MEIEVRAVELTGHQLETLPDDERVFLIQMAHLANTIMVLQKWLIFCEVHGPPKRVEAAAETTQQMLVMKIMSGVLYEGWQVIQASYHKAQLSKRYDTKLTVDGKRCLTTLKEYFNRRNRIQMVRNQFAFHFDRDTVLSELCLVEQDKPYHLYLSEFQGNCLYYLSEELVGLAMLHAMQSISDSAENPEVLRQLFNDLVCVSRAFTGFIAACLLLVLQERLPHVAWSDLERIKVSDAPSLDGTRIPFFVSKPDNAIPVEGRCIKCEEPTS